MIITTVSTPVIGLLRAHAALVGRGMSENNAWAQLGDVSQIAQSDLQAMVKRDAFALEGDARALGAAMESAGLPTSAGLYQVGMVRRAAEKEGADTFGFVLSTATPDRASDIVEQDWRLEEFSRNPVAPFCHDLRSPPIGTWEGVQVEAGRLMGDLRTAPIESYPLSITVDAYLRKGTLRTVSVGFMPAGVLWRGDLPKEDARASQFGLVYLTPTLHEASVVVVPMNAEAHRRQATPRPANWLNADWSTLRVPQGRG